MRVWGEHAIHLQNLPGSLTLKTEATPASPPTFAARCPAACDQCRKWKKAPTVLRHKKNALEISNLEEFFSFPFFGIKSGDKYHRDGRLPEVNKACLTGQRERE